MHCSNCGSYLAPGVRFCSGCGAAAPDPEATRIIRSPRPLPVNEHFPADYEDDDRAQGIFTVRPTLLLLLIPAYYHLKRTIVRYSLSDAKVEIDTGLIARTTRNIPRAKIHDVT